MTVFRKSMLMGLALLLAVAAGISTAVAQQPKGQPVPFDELPPEIQKKIKEKLKQLKASGQLPTAPPAAAAPEDAPKTNPTKPDVTKKTPDKPKPKKSEPSMNDEIKKMREEIKRMDTEFDLKLAEYKQQLAAERLAIEKAKLDEQIVSQKRAAQTKAVKIEIEKLNLATQLQTAQLKHQKSILDAQLAKLNSSKAAIDAKLAAKSAENRLAGLVLADPDYMDKPFKDGTLYISDRRIELNGPIMPGSAKRVTDRIQYFNNQSKKPIFIVIDTSPGGSGLEGLHILQAMRNSEAPVHVVVKRFAASMAAIITTLADHSYIYPNAIILHHQASSGSRGNVTLMKETLDRINEMSHRLTGVVAKKIGYKSEKDYVAAMYKARSSGDWDMFGDTAVKAKWVDHLVMNIRETGILKKPTDAPKPMIMRLPIRRAHLEEQTDGKGVRYVQLPKLTPLDIWVMYSPDGYYRP